MRRSDTIVIQTFRVNDRPAWIQRCLDSVRDWAALHGHDYSLAGDEFFDLCGPEYLARGVKNARAITNLARLVATRRRLDEGYGCVIWLDADVFVFDPASLILDFPAASLPTGYAFGREVWTTPGSWRAFSPEPAIAHNAATYFTKDAVDLDMLIGLICHIDAEREITSNYQLGVRLLRGLHYSLMFPTFSHVAIFSPTLIQAIVKQDTKVLAFYGRSYRYHACAANLTLSQASGNDNLIMKAMDRLRSTNGAAVNKYATEARLALIPFDEESRVINEPGKRSWGARLLHKGVRVARAMRA
jgi:hypothetical protein